MKRRQVQDTAGDDFLQELRRRLDADLEALGVAPGKHSFVVPKDFAARSASDAVLVSGKIAKNKPGRPSKEETDRIINAEVRRILDGRPTQRVLARQIFPSLPPAEAYQCYCQRAKDHREKIAARLKELKRQ